MINLKFLNILTILLILVINPVMASERLDVLFEEDVELMLESLRLERLQIKKERRELEMIESHLRKTLKGENVYLRLDKLGGTVVVIAIIIGSYKAYFPPGTRALLGGYATVKGMNRGVIRLSESEVTHLMSQINLLYETLELKEATSLHQLKHYCQLTKSYSLMCSDK